MQAMRRSSYGRQEGIVAEIEMALLAVMHEGDSTPTIAGRCTRYLLDDAGVHWVLVRQAVDTVTIKLVSFWISKEEGVDGHEFVEAFGGVITDISQNSCVDKRDG